jgi:hypothetical protein
MIMSGTAHGDVGRNMHVWLTETDANPRFATNKSSAKSMYAVGQVFR